MPTRKLSALLINTEGLSALTQASQRIAALQRLYVICAPPDLVQASRVINDRNGMLVIAADNGAIAAKLRQLAPRLLKNLQKRAAEITGIRVEVQVNRSQPDATARPEPKPLPIDLIDKIEDLSRQVKDPGLRTALSQFASRRRNRP